MSIKSIWKHNQRRRRKPEVIPIPPDQVVVITPPTAATYPPTHHATDVYVSAIGCGQSEKTACRAALDAEHRYHQEAIRRDTEYWVKGLAGIDARNVK